jgi:hypothetical protein
VGSDSSTSRIYIQRFIKQEHWKEPIPNTIWNATKGVSELRYLEQGEIRSTGAKDFSTEMEKLHSQIKG